jgi:hypothetical protein
MSYLTDRAEQRREDARLAAEQAREDARLAGEQHIELARLAAEQAREDTRLAAEQAAQAKADKVADKDKRRAKRAKRWHALREWAKAHPVDLLIYPLAVASAVMAVPSMAAYGQATLQGGTGLILPILSELGMWAFAAAVTVSRTRHPERPVWALQLGVWLFAGVAFGLNVLHGLSGEHGRWDAGVVMGVVSIAGVVAHQLATASPRRSRVERAEHRIRRQRLDKLAKARAASIRQSVAQIGPDGNAELIYTPGRFALTSQGRLDRVIVPGLPVDPLDPIGDTLAAEVTAWLIDTTPDSGPGPTSTTPDDAPPSGDRPGGRGPVATLDPPGDSASDLHPSADDRPSVPSPKHRSLEQLRAELADKVAAGTVNPTVVKSIREGLRIGVDRARQLRDEYRADAD